MLDQRGARKYCLAFTLGVRADFIVYWPRNFAVNVLSCDGESARLLDVQADNARTGSKIAPCLKGNLHSEALIRRNIQQIVGLDLPPRNFFIHDFEEQQLVLQPNCDRVHVEIDPEILTLPVVGIRVADAYCGDLEGEHRGCLARVYLIEDRPEGALIDALALEQFKNPWVCSFLRRINILYNSEKGVQKTHCQTLQLKVSKPSYVANYVPR